MSSEQAKPCESTCPKCGSDDVNRRLQAEGARYEVSFGDYPWIDEPWIAENKVTCGYHFARECILNHCRGCHYEWCSEPLAATP